MPKSKCLKLSINSGGYQTIKDNVNQLWKNNGEDITMWPTGAQLYEKIEAVMIPYGLSWSHRLDKVRNLYNKLTKQCYADHGT
jgi:hypothetical protein